VSCISCFAIVCLTFPRPTFFILLVCPSFLRPAFLHPAVYVTRFSPIFFSDIGRELAFVPVHIWIWTQQQCLFLIANDVNMSSVL